MNSPFSFSKQTSKCYKRNAISGDCELGFANNIIENFQSALDAKDPFINPPSLFEEGESFALIDISFCEQNKTNKS